MSPACPARGGTDMLPKPTEPGLTLVQITGPADDVEALFDALATSTGWIPATTVEAEAIPWEAEHNAQTWACYMMPDQHPGHTPETVDTAI